VTAIGRHGYDLAAVKTRWYVFIGGGSGPWRITRTSSVIGESLPDANYLEVRTGNVVTSPSGAVWVLKGATSHERYVTREEKQRLASVQPSLGRAEATLAALIPVKKSDEWWQLPQDERRAIFESRSRHIETGLQYLPAIARRLHHSYDLGEPFDFLTWFEYAPEHAEAFEELVSRLRETEEWRYVIREVDVRLQRTEQPA